MTQTKAKTRGGIMYILHRVVILFTCAAVFYPGFNPGRITTEISRYTSLLTSCISYKSLVGNLGRALNRGWIQASTFRLLMVASIVLVAGIILAAIGGCMSVGNDRMRFYGARFPLIGSLFMGAGLVLISVCHNQIVAADTARVPPNVSMGFYLFIVLAVLILLTSVAILFLNGKKSDLSESKMGMKEEYHLFLLFLPILALAFVFSYLPLWGWRYAFFDYSAGQELSMENFVGFKWFTFLFQNSATRNDLVRVMKNTLAMSAIGIVTSWLPMIFAILLTQINSKRFRRTVQTFTTVPNFLGWVIVYAVALAIFSTDGFINNFLNNILHIKAGTNYLMNNSHMWIKMWLWGTWKGLGWSAIIYISSISGIDPMLYEAATIDGAGRFGKIWNVTIPQLMPTFFVLLLMSIAGILSNGLDQYLVFENAMNHDSIEVLDLYVYNIGISNGLIPMSTVVGMAKSLISVILLFSANQVSKSLRGESII